MSLENEGIVLSMPVLALRGLVIFPKTLASFDVGRKKSANALKYAMEKNQLIYVVTQKDIYVDEPNDNDLYEMGCVVRVKQVLKVSDGLTKVLVEGLYRAKHSNFRSNREFLTANVEKCGEKAVTNREIYKESLLRRIRTQFEKYARVYSGLTPDIAINVDTNDDLGFVSDYIAFSIPAPYDDKQYVLEQLSPVKRAKVLLELLDKEREIGEIDRKINEKTKFAIDENQKEYYLREQMKVISNELYGDDSATEIEQYRAKVESLAAEISVKEKLITHINKLAKMPNGSHEGTVERNYLDTCIAMPWNSYTKVLTDIKKASKILERDIYGMQKVKERILELLSVYALSPDIKGQIICLVGPPGVGKTSIGKTIAECMGRRFSRVSLGGVHDEAEIRGHRKTYIGAMPGKIATAIKNSGSGNPLILLDEIDKLGSDYKGDPASAMLEVLDPEQNHAFCDHYIEMPLDLSKTVFIATANTTDSIPSPLLDRMEVIEISSYTREEKFSIAKKHLVPKQLSAHGLTSKQIKFNDDAIYSLIDFYTRESGVRKLERAIASICRKVAKIIVSSEKEKVIVTDKLLLEMLGKHKYKPEVILPCDEVGIINGLAWTSVGGEIMQLEVSVMEGTGKVELTGSLGDVMKESAKTAVSYVRANANKLGVDAMFYKNCDIHIHATQAAVPKDGPSAGVTITTALVSALTNKKIKRDIAMTGEVTLRGRVLAIGGLKEKTMAAYTSGVKTVFIPKENIPDLEDVDEKVKNNLKIIPVSYVDDILKYAFVDAEQNIPILSDSALLNTTVNTVSQ